MPIINETKPNFFADPRIVYAAERTLLAWIRTGLAMMGFGFVVARFSLLMRELIHPGQLILINKPGLSIWIGTALVSFGAIVNVVAGIHYAREIRRIRESKPLLLSVWTMGRFVSLALSLIGIVMVAYLVRLAS